MASKGIQGPFLLDPPHTRCTMHSMSTSIKTISQSLHQKKGLDSIGHTIIVSAHRAFGVLEIPIQALCHYFLVGYAKVEVKDQQTSLLQLTLSLMALGPISL
jgi:hypothetical protein